MTKYKLIPIIILILAGLIIVALPESGDRLFSLSGDHGPSMTDAAGILMIMAGYLWLGIEVYRRREKLDAYRSTKFYRTSRFISGIGVGLILASVLNDFGHWWIIGIVIVAGLQIRLFYAVLK